MGLAVATLIVLAVWGALTVSGEPEPRRSNLVVFTATMMIPLFLVWCAHVSGTEIASKLRTFTLPGRGLEALVLRVALQDRKWVARRWGRLPAAARILLFEDGLTLTWVDRTTSELRWSEAPQLSRRRVWAAHRRADAVRITVGDFFVEYVPFDAWGPLRGAASEVYFQSIVDLTSGQETGFVSQHRSRTSRMSRAARLSFLVAGIALTSMLTGCGYFYAPPGAEQREALENYLGERQTDRVSIRLSDYFGDDWNEAVIVCWSTDVDELAQLVPSDLTETDLVDTDAASRILFFSGSSFMREVTFGEDLLASDRWMLTVCPTDASLLRQPFADRVAVVIRADDKIRLTRSGGFWAMTADDFARLRLEGRAL